MMKLIAELDTDQAGRPLSIKAGGAEHFSIALKVKGASDNVQRVRYVLDPSYPNKVRTVPARIPEFEEPITSYGDYVIKVEYEEAGLTKSFTRLLSQALEDGLAESTSPDVRSAIDQIKKY